MTGRRVLCLSGSLRKVSANSAVLRAAQTLAPPSLELTLYAELADLPLFNPDDESSVLPASVQSLRIQVGMSDALLIACPEYAHGIPGAFKNLLDWLVGSVEFPGKPVALINTSGRGSHHAQAALREVLITMSAELIEAACVTVPLSGAGCEVESVLGGAVHVVELKHLLMTLCTALDAA